MEFRAIFITNLAQLSVRREQAVARNLAVHGIEPCLGIFHPMPESATAQIQLPPISSALLRQCPQKVLSGCW